MKDSEFTELLNLYLDHEISAADAARLEAEVLSNPARRRIYQDYCRMQKACKLLAAEFQTGAVPGAPGRIVAFDHHRTVGRRAPWLYASGALAAAACVAIAFLALSHSRPSGDSAGNIAATPSSTREDRVVIAAPDTIGTRSIPATVTVPARRPVSQANWFQPVALGSTANARSGLGYYLGNSAASDPQFEWLRKVRIAPIQRVSIEEFRFAKVPAPLRTENRTSPQPLRNSAEEMNALKFER
jgi:hypothetical protein